MFWAIGYIFENFLSGREVVVVGQGLNKLRWSVDIAAYAPISFSVDSISNLKENVDPAKHYVVICEDKYADHTKYLLNMEFREIADYYNWTKHSKTNGHLPIDIDYNGISIGYGSYFSFAKESFKHINSIGRFCSISNSAIIQGNHSMNRITTSSLYPILTKEAELIKNEATSDKDPRGTNRKISIGNDVWIGANVFINASKAAKIGDGAIIGTGSLVMDDVPPYSIVYGTPAKVQRYRFSPEQIEALLRVKWWEWSKDAINEKIELLMSPELFFKEFGLSDKE